jgi:hypothetical protein
VNRLSICMCLSAAAAFGADKLIAPQLIDPTRGSADKLREALVATLGEDNIQQGTAVAGRGSGFHLGEAASRPLLIVDETAGPMVRNQI